MLSFNPYLREIQTALNTGKATEHSYRPALQALLKGLADNVEAVNEPQRKECGAPDFIFLRDEIPIGYVECKDINRSLDKAERSDQLKRYRSSLPNLILTDYLEFRWFRNGELRRTARLGSVVDGQIKCDTKGFESVRNLLQSFITCDTPVIGTTKELAERMAKTAQLIRDAITSALAMEDRGGTLHHQMEAFRTTLLHDITEDKFADMYAQTICYGLFMARVNHLSGHFTRQKAPHLLPKSNPFLRQMFDHIAGIKLDDRIVWAVDNLAEIFHRSDMSAILTEFGKRTSGKDPVLHFYEDFLAAYDPKMRKKRGVYYTPEPVVSYIVRSVDKILKRDFNLEAGLADATKIPPLIPPHLSHRGKAEQVHKVQILDPAAGTGSFLHGVVDHIRQSFAGNEGMWQGYVDHDLLPRLFGFELLMAPYTIAHLKVGMLLKESHYEFAGDKRLKIYLTNSLEESSKQINRTMMFGFDDWLIKESSEASDIKADAPVMVVLGNPPYAGHSENKGEWIKKLVFSYIKGHSDLAKPAQAKWLSDDYVKFIRFAQWRIEQTGYGVLAFITNHSYLDNPTFHGMRHSLMTTFDDIYLIDLHGNSKKKEKCPDGSKDENVFDIQQGVGIGIFVKTNSPLTLTGGDKGGGATIHHTDLWGFRKDKYKWLAENEIDSTDWTILNPISPFYLFIPQDTNLWNEYEAGWKIPNIFNQNGDPAPGIVTTHDQFAISFSSNEIKVNIENLLATESERDARKLFRLCSQNQWQYDPAKKSLSNGKWRDKIVPILYRPFDIRWTVFDSNVAVHRRERVMHHMLAGENLGLIGTRQTRDRWGVFATKRICGHKSCSAYDINSIFPLYIYPEDEPRRPNLSPEFMAELSARIGFEPTPEQVFYYIYAVFHSPTYRSRYAEFLKMDFPRVPLPPDAELFRELCPLGEELVGYHLMERAGPELVKYPIAGDDIVEQVKYSDKDRRVWINKTQYFEGVPPDVWEFHIGGYQVCSKWLKDRKGRTLSYDDIRHYGQIISALAETIRLMDEIDKAAVRLFEVRHKPIAGLPKS